MEVHNLQVEIIMVVDILRSTSYFMYTILWFSYLPRLDSTAPSVMFCLSGRTSLWNLHDSLHSRERYTGSSVETFINKDSI